MSPFTTPNELMDQANITKGARSPVLCFLMREHITAYEAFLAKC